MPFIGLDWRSPGESWIKTPTGSWERMKILENLSLTDVNNNSDGIQVMQQLLGFSERDATVEIGDFSPISRPEENTNNNNVVDLSDISNLNLDNESIDAQQQPESTASSSPDPAGKPGASKMSIPRTGTYQPYCHVFSKPTRERRAHMSLSEAFWKLDFPGAVKDTRRSNFVCKVLDVLISENLTSLGGQAQKLLFTTLEHVVGQVISTQQNIHIIRMLMQDLNEAMQESNMMWGKHMGSSIMWQQHRHRLHQWNEIMDKFGIHQREEDGKLMLTDLPEECLRLVLLCLSDHHDLTRSEEAFSTNKENMSKFGPIFNEQRLWRELCFFHFTPQQLKHILAQSQTTKDDWESTYRKMKRYFGLKETYAEALHLCLHCRILFWEPYGHPCSNILSSGSTSESDGSPPPPVEWRSSHMAPVPISPRSFLELFSL